MLWTKYGAYLYDVCSRVVVIPLLTLNSDKLEVSNNICINFY
jgi:hypothetical protein